MRGALCYLQFVHEARGTPRLQPLPGRLSCGKRPAPCLTAFMHKRQMTMHALQSQSRFLSS